VLAIACLWVLDGKASAAEYATHKKLLEAINVQGKIRVGLWLWLNGC
jgi:hypothetical protein